MSGWAVGYKAPVARTVTTVVETLGKGGDGSKGKKQAQAAVAELNKRARAKLDELEKDYNKAEEGSREQAEADLAWWATRAAWAEAYKKLAPGAGLKLTDEDQAWIDDAPKALAAAREKWSTPAPREEDQPLPPEEPDVAQGASQEAKSQPLSVQRQVLIDEAEPWKTRLEEIDFDLAKIDSFRQGAEILFPEDALLVASEDDLKEERAGLSDQLETTRSSLQKLGGETAGIAGRSAAPTGEGHREAIRRLWWDTGRSTRAIKSGVDTAFGLGVDRPSIAGAAVGGTAHALLEPGVFPLRRAKEKHVAQAPAGHLFAPKPPGGASPEALEALRKKHAALSEAAEERSQEVKVLSPQIEALNTKLRRGGVQVQGGDATDVLISTRAENNPDAQAFRMLVDRRDKLRRENQRAGVASKQMERGISHMESVLSEQEQE